MRTRDTDKQELVKRTAVGLFVKDGLEGFSMNKLARACGISVATLYIYYQDKDDLIVQIGIEEAQRMAGAMLDDFDPDMPFREGLRKQWENRSRYQLANLENMRFFELLRTSTYQKEVTDTFFTRFKDVMGRFYHNAVRRGEIDAMPVAVFWSVAYGPLYQLLKFHQEGRSIGGMAFELTDEMIWTAFDLVVKALCKK